MDSFTDENRLVFFVKTDKIVTSLIFQTKIVWFFRKPLVFDKIKWLPFSSLKFEILIFYPKSKTEKNRPVFNKTDFRFLNFKF
jgi:hypothetical protein